MARYKIGDKFNSTLIITDIVDNEVELIIKELDEVNPDAPLSERVYIDLDHLDAVFNPLTKMKRLESKLMKLKEDEDKINKQLSELSEMRIKGLDKHEQ